MMPSEKLRMPLSTPLSTSGRQADSGTNLHLPWVKHNYENEVNLWIEGWPTCANH